MTEKIKQIAKIFSSFNPTIHEYEKGNNVFDFIKVKNSSYIVSFINKDINNFDYLDEMLQCLYNGYIWS